MSLSLSLNSVLKLAFVLLSVSAVAQAGSFSSVVVYGDSLSDNGNLFAATGQPGAPYYQGRRSDGLVAVERSQPPSVRRCWILPGSAPLPELAVMPMGKRPPPWVLFRCQACRRSLRRRRLH